MKRKVMTGTLAISIAVFGASDVVADDTVIAISAVGYALTIDAAIAYTEALEFSLAHVGATPLTREQKIDGLYALAEVFPTLSVEEQAALANARQTWNAYRSSWNRLGAADRQEFLYEVLAFVHGDDVAQQAVYGYSPGAQPTPHVPEQPAGSENWVVTTPHDGGAAVYDAAERCSYYSVNGISVKYCR